MSADYITLFGAVAPVFLIIAAGYAIRRVGWLTTEADASLMRVIVNLLFPCLILDTILGNQALAIAGNVLLAPAVGFVTIVGGYAVSYYAAPVLGIQQPRQRRTFAFTTGMYNYGYVPLPLIQKLFDEKTTAVLFTHNVGVEIALWSCGVMLLRGRADINECSSMQRPADEPGAHVASARTTRLPRCINAPVVAILAAIALHFASAQSWLPGIALSAAHNLGSAAIPLGLILTGATFADQFRNLAVENAKAVSAGAILLRLGVLPVLMLLLARCLPCPLELRRVVLVQAAMPCAVIPVLVAAHYDGDPSTAMRIVLITSACGLLTVPLWIQLGLRWLGG